MMLTSPNFDVKLIIFSRFFARGLFPKLLEKALEKALEKSIYEHASVAIQ